jgi:hypothetical protein
MGANKKIGVYPYFGPMDSVEDFQLKSQKRKIEENLRYAKARLTEAANEDNREYLLRTIASLERDLVGICLKL